MGMIKQETAYVVYNKYSYRIPDYVNQRMIEIPAGYHLSPYPQAGEEIKFQGSLWDCVNVLMGLYLFECMN